MLKHSLGSLFYGASFIIEAGELALNAIGVIKERTGLKGACDLYQNIEQNENGLRGMRNLSWY